MTTVLVISSHATPLVQRVITCLDEIAARAVVLDAASAEHTHLTLSVCAEGDMCSERSCINVDGETVRMSDVAGIFLPAPSSFAYAEGLGDRDSRFVYSEYTAFVRYLSHALDCKLVNRLRPEFWAEPVLGPHAIRAFVSPEQCDGLPIVDMRMVAGSAIEENDLGIGRDLAIWPFSQSSDYLPMDGFRATGVRQAADVVPLRMVESSSAEGVDVSVVGQTAHLPKAANGCFSDRCFIEEASIDVCRDLGVTFGQARWVLAADGPYLAEVRTWPHVDDDDTELIDAVASTIARELVT